MMGTAILRRARRANGAVGTERGPGAKRSASEVRDFSRRRQGADEDGEFGVRIGPEGEIIVPETEEDLREDRLGETAEERRARRRLPKTGPLIPPAPTRDNISERARILQARIRERAFEGIGPGRQALLGTPGGQRGVTKVTPTTRRQPRSPRRAPGSPLKTLAQRLRV